MLKRSIPTAEHIRKGLPAPVLEQLADRLGISHEQMLSVVRMSRATWSRRRQAGRLSHEESDRLANLIRAHAKALDYFDGNEDAARRWMKHPAPAFDGETPLGRCDTGLGTQEVIDLLFRLEHGIPA